MYFSRWWCVAVGKNVLWVRGDWDRVDVQHSHVVTLSTSSPRGFRPGFQSVTPAYTHKLAVVE